jgi:hypothetical protein
MHPRAPPHTTVWSTWTLRRWRTGSTQLMVERREHPCGYAMVTLRREHTVRSAWLGWEQRKCLTLGGGSEHVFVLMNCVWLCKISLFTWVPGWLWSFHYAGRYASQIAPGWCQREVLSLKEEGRQPLQKTSFSELSWYPETYRLSAQTSCTASIHAFKSSKQES